MDALVHSYLPFFVVVLLQEVMGPLAGSSLSSPGLG
jgi:hypothetical protein